MTSIREGAFRSALLKIFAGQIGFAILSFGASLLTARLLGPSGRGDLAILILVPVMYATAFEFGQEATLSHVVARIPERVGSLHANALVFAIGLLVPAAVLVATALWILHVVPGRLILLAIAGGFATAAGVYLRMLAGLAIGTDRIGRLNFARLILGAAFPLLVVLAAIRGREQPASFFYAWALTTVLAAFVLGILMRSPWRRPSLEIAWEQLRTGFPAHLSNLSQVVLLRGDQFLLVALASTASVGHYSVAVNIAEALWYLPVAAGLASLPILSGTLPESTKLHALRHALKVSILATLGGAALVAAVAPFAVPLGFGDEFSGAILPLELLLPGVVLAALTRVCTAALIAKESTQLMWKIMLASVVVNVAMNFALIPFLGASGAALASSISYGFAGCGLLVATMTAWDPNDLKFNSASRMLRSLIGKRR